MTNENRVKFKRALAKVTAQMPADIEAELTENSAEGKAFSVTLPIAGSENDALFMFDPSKAPHEGKYNFVIGVMPRGTKQLSAVHAVMGQSREQLVKFFQADSLNSKLAELLANASDKLDAKK
ncbi:hypothetical protein [Ruminococcus sp.]|uniref:hypothetical protein n=1 Tax=Ruminococcus sp. TaxID=41978 RepID=UPI0025CDBBBE|nr:hypothetical protein [Ruminococcus sp.]MBQ8967688.1 hypothetical protein [Ruminococcus sp.]